MADPVVWGMVGGVLGEFANVYDHWNEDRQNLPHYLRRPGYYLMSSAMAVAGGLIVAAHQDSGVDLNGILAMNVGVTAPLLIKAAVRGTPFLKPGTTDQDDPAAGSAPSGNGSGSG